VDYGFFEGGDKARQVQTGTCF